MKPKAVGSLFLVLTLAAGIAAIVPSAFADHMKVNVSIPQGSATPGCEETNSCYIPSDVSVDVDGEVTWTNDDTAAHTVTSGDPTNGPDGMFDSSLIAAGKTFSFILTEVGTYNYFCQVHPWMTGIVTVEGAMESGEEEGSIEEENEVYANAMSSDGSVKVAIEADKPSAGEEISIHVTFTNADGSPVSHINYDISATQDGAEVLSESGMHEHEGTGMHITDALASDSPVDVQVTILGIGLPDEEVNWTGPRGDVVPLQVTPEFGPVVMIILAMAVVSIIAITAKTRVIPKL